MLRIIVLLVIITGGFFALLFGLIVSDPSWLETREALTGHGTKTKTWIGFVAAIITVIAGLAYLMRSFTIKGGDT